MANEPDDRGTTSGRVTPKGGPATQPPATKAAARKAAAAAASRKADQQERAGRPGPRKVERNADGTIDAPAKDGSAKASAKPKVDPKAAARSGDPKKKAAAAASESSRYTPPIPQSYKVSPWWIPALMFGFLGLGAIIIILNYINWPFGEPSNWRLLAGLGSILAGILVATRYQ